MIMADDPMSEVSASPNTIHLPNKIQQLIESIDRLTATIEKVQLIRHETETTATSSPASFGPLSVTESADLNSKKLRSPWQRIDVSSDEEIVVEDGGYLDELNENVMHSRTRADTDPWKALINIDSDTYFKMGWANQHERDPKLGGNPVPDIIRYYSDNDDIRLIRQKLLFVGLSRWWWHHGKPFSDEYGHIPSTLDMGPLISLIGMRLASTMNLQITRPSSADVAVRVLIEMLLLSPQIGETNALRVQKSTRALWADSITLGELLDRCYERKVFTQPDAKDLKSHLEHASYVMNALKLANIWSFISITKLTDATSVDEIRSMSLSDVWLETQMDPELEPPFEKSSNTSFRSRDLCLTTIQNAGKLHIEWTPLLEEHLDINIEDSTLKVFWFGFAVRALPPFHLGCRLISRYVYCHVGDSPFGGPLDIELRQTYSLLFRSRSGSYRANIAAYGTLAVPEWLRVFYGDKNELLSEKLAKNLSYFTSMKRPWPSDIEIHVEDMNMPIPEIQMFDKYRAFGDKLRILQAYLDSQKPGGILGLWSDNRDTSGWYTFWAVFFIGGISLIFSFLSLVTTVIQTSATL